MTPRHAVRFGIAAALVATAVTVPLAVGTAGAQVTPTSTTVAGINVDKATIPQLEKAMNRHRLTSVQLVEFYLKRIRALNPKLHAVITVSKRGVADARAADRKRANGVRKPLLGIPILVKDNIDTTGMPTTAGSLALKGSSPPDAFIVTRLKRQGALIIGKTNLSEWANFRSSQSSSGWSAVGGQTNSAYALDRNPCGSSAGSGVAASADLATVAIGTETDGSIVCPSGQNGDVGIKPTLGLASRAGIVPISAEQDTAGPITRNVTDAAVVLGAMTGVDPRDPATKAQRGHVHSSYRAFLKKNALKGARIGIWRKTNFGVSPETDRVMKRAIARLKQLGATIVTPTNIAIDPAFGPEGTALNFEFKHDIHQYLKTYTKPHYPKTLKGLIKFDNRHKNQELRFFGQEQFLAAQATGSLSSPEYKKARAKATSIARNAISDTLQKFNLDAIIAPTNSPAWTTDLVNGDHFSIGSSSPSAISGYPSVTVPAGYALHLPIGMSLIGPKWSEPKLISLAYSWEQATHIRKAPQFRASIP
ncbi:MAG TPA: amidase [Jatrophihabitantaceae bacterium]|nr:amidase [Jatrophihabitantaceae bacterium]